MRLSRISTAFLFLPSVTLSLQVPLQAASPIESLKGVLLRRVVEEGRISHELNEDDTQLLDLGTILGAPDAPRTLLVFGTYPADFNMIEYAQKVRHYLPILCEKKGVKRALVVVNGGGLACLKLADLLDLPPSIEIFSDPAGEAGRAFGVSRGWRPDDDNLNAFLKLYLMLFGLGPPRTLPAVISGYIGNPWGKRGWIETALLQGQTAGRWPDNVLDLTGGSFRDPPSSSSESPATFVNNFDNLPIVGSWGRRPLELATLRLQNLVMSFKNWDLLKPEDERCLTQLGGCVVIDPVYAEGSSVLYSWLDDGICDVPDFEDILAALPDVGQ